MTNRAACAMARGLRVDLTQIREGWQRRGAAIVLTLIVEGLLLWLFLSLSVSQERAREAASRLTRDRKSVV